MFSCVTHQPSIAGQEPPRSRRRTGTRLEWMGPSIGYTGIPLMLESGEAADTPATPALDARCQIPPVIPLACPQV